MRIMNKITCDPRKKAARSECITFGHLAKIARMTFFVTNLTNLRRIRLNNWIIFLLQFPDFRGNFKMAQFAM